MVYNDVAVGEYREYISQNFNYGEPVKQTNTLHLSDISQKLIQDKSKLSVVVRLQDRSGSWPWAEGRIQIDCDKLPITASGDTNGDGAVNAADIVEIVCYIMGKPSDKFITDRADVNRDGVVNAADIVEIVNKIMKNE